MGNKILISIDSESEANSSYHVTNVALHLKRLGFIVSVQFAQIMPGTTMDLLRQQNIESSVIGTKIRDLDFLYLWSPRSKNRSIANLYDYKHLIVHVEDNDWYLEELLGNLDSLGQIDKTLEKSSLITYINSNTSSLIPKDIDTYLLLPGVDDATFSDIQVSLPLAKISSGFYLYAGNVTDYVLEGLTNIAFAVKEYNRKFDTEDILLVTGRDWTNQLLHRIPDVVVIGNFLAKDMVSKLMRKSIANLQCSSQDEFDLYRFPSKLPEYLISGRPTLIERFTLDIELRNKENCLEVVDKSMSAWLEGLIQLRMMSSHEIKTLGESAKDFALQNLSWNKSVSGLADKLLKMQM